MQFENTCVVRVPRQKLWDFLIVVPNVAACLPGVEEVNALSEKDYTGMVGLKMGIVKLKLRGKITVESIDSNRYETSLVLQAADRKISGLIQGKMGMRLDEIAEEETKLTVQTEVSLLGKIGEFGQGLIKKKADQMMAAFAATLVSKVSGEPQ